MSAKPVAVLHNLTDGQIALPPLAESKADLDAGKGQVFVLGAQCDRGIAGAAQPELPLNAFQLQQVRSHRILKALLNHPVRRSLEIRSPNLDLTLSE